MGDQIAQRKKDTPPMGSWSNVCGGVEVVAGSLSVENWYTDAFY